MSNKRKTASRIGLEYRVDEVAKLRAKSILDSKCLPGITEWFMEIFKEEPEAVARKIYKDELLRHDIPVICFEIRGNDCEWTQKLCDEIQTLLVEQ